MLLTLLGTNNDGVVVQQNLLLLMRWGVFVPYVRTSLGQPAGKGGRKQKRKQYRVEIDGQAFTVASPEEARELLEEAEELARERAAQAAERAANAPKRAKRKVLADAAKTLLAPDVRVVGAEIDAEAAAIQQAAQEFMQRIQALYAEAMQAIEIGALMRWQIEQDEEEAAELLLMTL